MKVQDYAKNLVNGTCFKNLFKMENIDKADVALKVVAAAVIAGLLTNVIGAVIVTVVAFTYLTAETSKFANILNLAKNGFSHISSGAKSVWNAGKEAISK